MNKTTLLWIGAGILIGIVFAQQVQKIPLVNKIPQV